MRAITGSIDVHHNIPNNKKIILSNNMQLKESEQANEWPFN